MQRRVVLNGFIHREPSEHLCRRYMRSTECPSSYRATHMHSADYAVAIYLSVCPSVCHTPILCLNGYIYPDNFFSPSGRPTILVCPHQTGWQYSDGYPLTGASNARGYDKITIFSQYLALSRK